MPDPTEEQTAALDLFRTGRPLVIEAGAGTGKTTTLEMLGRSTTEPGYYGAFNAAVAAEVHRRMPMNVEASTVHSLAMRHVGGLLDARRRLEAPRMAPWTLAKRLDIDRLIVTVGGKAKVLQAGWLAGKVMRSIRNFCQSSDPLPTAAHVPHVPGIDEATTDGRPGHRNNRELSRWLEPYVLKAWADLIDPNGKLPFTHDVYLKVFQLDGVELPVSFVLFDEAQDANPVMLGIMATQANSGRQVVYVGDSQQQIYEWRGAVNALADVEGANRTFLTQSFRFGPDLAEVANAILDRLDADLRLTGTPSIPTRVHPVAQPRAILCRSNSAAVDYVLALQREGRNPMLVGGSKEIVEFARAAAQLQSGETTWHRDLACFDSWREVQDYVDTDPQGDDLRTMVRMLDDYGPQIILDALAGLAGEDSADVVVSTAHKAKGREWESVRLAGDFEIPGEHAPGEWRLLYVAATRARLELDTVRCAPLGALLGRRYFDPVAALATT